MADKKAHAAGIKKAAVNRMRALASQKAPVAGAGEPGMPGGRPLTPADLPESDKQALLENTGVIPSSLEAAQAGQPLPQVQGGVPAAPTPNVFAQQAQAIQQNGMAPPPPAAAAPAQTPIGPGVTVSPPVITPAPAPASAPQAVMAPPMPSGSDMPDPHAPEAQDEDPDDEDDSYANLPWAMG